MDEKLNNLKRICKLCLKEDYRIIGGKFGKFGKDTRWMNLEGKCWNGNTCPKCNVVRVRHNIRRMRDERRAKLKPEVPK